MLRVKVKDVDIAGDVLDAVVGAGANQVFGVSFTLADEGAWQDQARERAIADAGARAGELAALTGVELGPVHSISEVIGSCPGEMLASRGFGSEIAPGELEFSTQVQVTYTIQ